MPNSPKPDFTNALRWWCGQFRRPELMVFLPAVTLAAFWYGGERALIVTALCAPLIFALAGAFRFAEPLDATTTEPGRRTRLMSMLERALRDGAAGGASSVCFVVQIDDMEGLARRHGRQAQAEVLARSAERLTATLRPADVVARLEGAAFAIVLEPVRRLDLESAVQIAARLQSSVAVPVSLDATRLQVSASIGFCLSDRAPAPRAQALLDAALLATDDATANGPGAIRAFAPDMIRRQAARVAMREEIEAALDNGQIRPWFQPQVSTDTGAISGFEALARWQHPVRGLVPPAEFLPLIEQTGLATRLGEVILRDALQALARWDRAGLGVPEVAVNFSAEELRDPKLADKLKWELDRFDLQPARLTVEVLESVVAETAQDVIVSNIAALARLGCGIDLDDFGTGHASITSIRRFAVRRLKIDRSFVTRIDEDREQQKIVIAVLAMAEQLGLATLAEGVETPGEHAMLAQLGCGDVQGFGIARPMPFEDTIDWIARHRAAQSQTPRIGGKTRRQS
jgi:diguanylate cyclase (GGDEF)-like protein